MEKLKEYSGKVLYGLLFAAVIPLLLVLWAKHTDRIINLPVPENLNYGYILIAAGITILGSGMLNLLILGQGLPMSAYPPKQLVTKGIYSVFKHPVYYGAILLSFGISVAFSSPAGLWLVSPLFTLMIIAWMTGFEKERTDFLFGKQDYTTFFSLPANDINKPSSEEKCASYLLVFVPWVIVYETFIFAGIPNDAVITNLPFEKNLPVWEFTEAIYSFTYLFVLLIPLFLKTRKQLRHFITDAWFAIIIAGLFYFAFPFIVQQRAFIPQTFWGRLILYERSMDGATCALPSFHVIWAFIGARYLTDSIKGSGLIWYTVAILISISCITTGNHSIPDVIAGCIFWLIIRNRHLIWDFIRKQSEKLANSWHEWRWGPVRIINHGFYGGAAGFVGTLIASSFLDPEYSVTAFVIMIFVIIGAALWAQIIEGSPRLLRPYGYYGGVIGVIAASALLSFITSVPFFVLLASFSMAGPWIQATGRLRCLIQGCCHGKPSDEITGIRFTHPNSRVNKISGLNGVPLYPTQLYSIACNIVTGFVLLRFYSLGLPAAFIVGMYLILNGLGRFVEESLRGEAQTPYWAGMRIYQWIAILNIFFGAVCTSVPDANILTFHFNPGSIILALIMGIVVMAASGVDFPESGRRFARLTSN
jgi:protein-S-isoprenylcysteine O-methyltransferase Ste14